MKMISYISVVLLILFKAEFKFRKKSRSEFTPNPEDNWQHKIFTVRKQTYFHYEVSIEAISEMKEKAYVTYILHRKPLFLLKRAHL